MSSRPASGTNSLIFGARASVRLPRRIVPIWVSEPIGRANPLRMANTPAMVVVATAPRPTSSTPSLPRAGAISSGEVTIGHYIIPPAPSRFAARGPSTRTGEEMRRFLRKSSVEREPLPVTMTGVRMGERVLQIGLADARLASLLAAKPGLSGHAALVVPDEQMAERARVVAAEAGLLVDVHVAPVHALPIADQTFDVVIVHDAATLLAALAAPARATAMAESARVLRSGGRLI